MVARRLKFNDAMIGLQEQMSAKLTVSRRTLTHPGSIGDVAELEWVALLSEYLPNRYCADKGFVVDHKGNVSDQIDILIYDNQYTPFILHVNGVKYIPAEAIYAAIECKQDINPSNIIYASKKARSVRRLVRTSMPIIHAGGQSPPKKPHNILCGLICVGGGISSRTHGALLGLSDASCLNFVCSLSGIYSRLEGYALWSKQKRPFLFNTIKTRISLVKFLLELVADLQNIGTVSAIDVRKYLSLIK